MNERAILKSMKRFMLLHPWSAAFIVSLTVLALLAGNAIVIGVFRHSSTVPAVIMALIVSALSFVGVRLIAGNARRN
jgi:hypothetical protein